MSFEEITQKTYCPFAKPSKMGPGITIRTADVESELVNHREIISDFFRTAAERSRDGMIVTFEDTSLGITLDALVDLTRRFYTVLTHLFSSVYIPDDPQPDERWYAMIEGELFFLVSFAPCYPETSPRYTHGDRRTYFLLQPASTFERHAKAIGKATNRNRPRVQRGRQTVRRATGQSGERHVQGRHADRCSWPKHIPWWIPAGDTTQQKADSNHSTSEARR